MVNGLSPVYIKGTVASSGGAAVSGYAFVDQSGNLAVNASVVATANISGQSVFVMSGSGPIVVSSGVVLASGVILNLSGVSFSANVSGNIVYLASGFNNVREVGSTIINSSLSGAYIITGNSGGNTLFSGGPLISTTLRNASGNNVMFIGGLNTNAPTTNIGIPLFANESLTLKVVNFNAISAFASTSGQILYYIGLA